MYMFLKHKILLILRFQKQVTHRPHRLPEKAVWINKQGMKYILTLIRGRKNPLNLLWGFNGPNLLNRESPLLKDALCQFFKYCQCIFTFHNYIPLGKCLAKHMKHEFSQPKDVLCKVWLQLTLRFWRNRWKCEKWK